MMEHVISNIILAQNYLIKHHLLINSVSNTDFVKLSYLAAFRPAIEVPNLSTSILLLFFNFLQSYFQISALLTYQRQMPKSKRIIATGVKPENWERKQAKSRAIISYSEFNIC